MAEPTESVIIRVQQKFQLNDILNPVEVEIKNNRILIYQNILIYYYIILNIFFDISKKYKNVYYKLTPLDILFSASITNDTKQIFVTCTELNDAKNR